VRIRPDNVFAQRLVLRVKISKIAAALKTDYIAPFQRFARGGTQIVWRELGDRNPIITVQQALRASPDQMVADIVVKRIIEIDQPPLEQGNDHVKLA
jgi:hypothetical protein